MRPQTFIVNQTLIIYMNIMRFLCEIIKGESQAEHTERESEIARWGEREREKVEGEGTALVFIEDSYFWF